MDVAAGDIHYVSPSGGNVAPYTNWADAATDIQAAVDVASGGDTVLVNDGTYDAGGKAIGAGFTNRVAIAAAVTVESVNGPASTFIRGQGPVGPDAVRCAYVCSGAVLAGFTLTDGCTRSEWDPDSQESGGGGAWCESDGVMSNCVVAGNTAGVDGGGAFGGEVFACLFSGNTAMNGRGGGWCSESGGILSNCTFVDNTAEMDGGGAFGGQAFSCAFSNNTTEWGCGGGWYGAGSGIWPNCRFVGNHAGADGGGWYGESGGTLSNCTFTGNTAGMGGGGAYGGAALSCVFLDNTAESGGGWWGAGAGALARDCTFVGNSAGMDGGGGCGGQAESC
ncbi:MAG: hypothetical protein JXR37_18890, partial [Kiritimatiellae bacterium]|nr:hypothetical protein [Kiritimatiellia bacterium]